MGLPAGKGQSHQVCRCAAIGDDVQELRGDWMMLPRDLCSRQADAAGSAMQHCTILLCYSIVRCQHGLLSLLGLALHVLMDMGFGTIASGVHARMHALLNHNAARKHLCNVWWLSDSLMY